MRFCSKFQRPFLLANLAHWFILAVNSLECIVELINYSQSINILKNGKTSIVFQNKCAKSDNVEVTNYFFIFGMTKQWAFRPIFSSFFPIIWNWFQCCYWNYEFRCHHQWIYFYIVMQGRGNRENFKLERFPWPKGELAASDLVTTD